MIDSILPRRYDITNRRYMHRQIQLIQYKSRFRGSCHLSSLLHGSLLYCISQCEWKMGGDEHHFPCFLHITQRKDQYLNRSCCTRTHQALPKMSHTCTKIIWFAVGEDLSLLAFQMDLDETESSCDILCCHILFCRSPADGAASGTSRHFWNWPYSAASCDHQTLLEALSSPTSVDVTLEHRPTLATPSNAVYEGLAEWFTHASMDLFSNGGSKRQHCRQYNATGKETSRNGAALHHK